MKVKTFPKLVTIGTTFVVVALAIPALGVAANEAAKAFGFKKTPVPVVGTGSMYPSLYWEKSEGGPEDPATTTLHEHRTTPRMYRFIPEVKIMGRKISLRTLGLGDMVAFRNDATREILESEGKDTEAGFIKRVIGLEGDTIEVRDGFVVRNGQVIGEPYINKPRSTYGGTTLPDCNAITVPEDHVFVLGDNRKLSSDSRDEVGLIREVDITFVLPFDEQGIYQDLWRDTSNDTELAHQPTLNKQDFYNRLNSFRQEAGSTSLQPRTALTTSAQLRAGVILETNDFSTEATRSGYTMPQALADAGYGNIATGEFISQGYYTAEELMTNLTYFASTRSQLLNNDYQDIGVAVVNGEVADCPTQVIVGHLGGYVPADYDQETIDNWKALKDNLEAVIPSWEAARAYEGVDQDKLEELLAILYDRRTLANEVYDAMMRRQWLTDDQKRRIDEDQVKAARANQLIQELNQQ